MLSQNGGDAYAMEGLLLQLALEERLIPEEVLPKLTLSDHHLIQVSPELLMKLCQQLANSDRPADGARVALVAARGFTAECQPRRCEEAFLKAFSLDRSNQEAAEGLAKAVASAHKCCEELGDRCGKLEDRCDELNKKGQASEEGRKALEAQCEALRRRCSDLESQRIVWDLSGYDFSNFRKGQLQESEEFQLNSGVTAWLDLYPKGDSESSEGKAALYLSVDKPATVKWTFQSGSGEVWTTERDFSQAALNPDGTPEGWGRPDFMPVSKANGSVTLRILSVQVPGSTLRFG